MGATWKRDTLLPFSSSPAVAAPPVVAEADTSASFSECCTIVNLRFRQRRKCSWLDSNAHLELAIATLNEARNYLASSSWERGMPLRRQVMSIGWSPLASQINEARSPFLTESLTDFSLKCGGAAVHSSRKEERQFMRFGMLHGLATCITSGAPMQITAWHEEGRLKKKVRRHAPATPHLLMKQTTKRHPYR